MKRFYKGVEAVPDPSGVGLALDGRAVRTPGRNLLRVPTEELAAAIAEEWAAQGEEIDPRTMPLTGLANAAIDRIEPDPAAFARSLALYGESDLLCYLADGPRPLVARQAEVWDPPLAWARRRYDVDFALATGIMHRPQPPLTLERLAQAVAARGSFQLAGLSPLVTISGSLVLALALAEGAMPLDEGWDAAILDEAWQAEQWGADPLAALSLENRRREFDAAYRFLTFL